MIYKVPKEFYYRLHHIRPRFKNDVEHVLIFMATEISKIGRENSKEFANKVNDAIKIFPGNVTKKRKTIDNWRTEISSLFGLIQSSISEDMSWPGRRAIELANNQDLVHFFKLFLYHFQYPGGHLKPHENISVIEKGVKFKPTQYILELLTCAEKLEKDRAGINKAEVTHLVYNDIRVTRDQEEPDVVWKRIKRNRDARATYDWIGDVTRYAGDILDYMVIANLLVRHGQLYFINNLEKEAIQKFLDSPESFDEYDPYIKKRSVRIEQVSDLQEPWFGYVNQDKPKDFFRTDILAFIATDEDEYRDLRKRVLEKYAKAPEEPSEIRAKEIGDIGEGLIHGHECMRIKKGGREDLIRQIKPVPSALALGYDIKSVELNERPRYIEVKTTISRSELNFERFHLTTAEWKIAEQMKKSYYVYRLLLSKEGKRLFLLRDPVGQYKLDKLDMTPRDGADIFFSPGRCGEYTELLEWKE